MRSEERVIPTSEVASGAPLPLEEPEVNGSGTPSAGLSLVRPRVPKQGPLLVAIFAAAVATGLVLALGWSLLGAVVTALVLFTFGVTTWSAVMENRRSAVDRAMTCLVWSALAIALVPLVSVIWKVFSAGWAVLSTQFFTYSMRNVIGEGGGIYHAIMGTLLITAGAAAISVPVGLMCAVYLVEYGANSRLARVITFLVDVMTGIPSIVAGLFAYALFALIFGEGIRMGFGGSVALSLLMVPIVIRSAEEMFKLVPDDLREASYALGVTKWRTIVRVVLPTSLAGVVTGVTLAVARVIGETAPLLIIAGSTDSTNTNLFAERMMTLPVFIYYSYTQPGIPPEFGQARAWGAALVLIAIVMALNLVARLVGYFFSPKTRS
jgi:phosphate transport system permease protein